MIDRVFLELVGHRRPVIYVKEYHNGRHARRHGVPAWIAKGRFALERLNTRVKVIRPRLRIDHLELKRECTFQSTDDHIVEEP